ncbi:ESPR-type extended signal peptide-containing protein, partial [Negativicoccus succinicivorans]
MNKIYKLIWSKVKNCWVVTSEMANSHVKSTSGRAKGSVLAASVLTVLLGSALFPADMVYAADGAAHYVNVAVNTGKTIDARDNQGNDTTSAVDPTVNYDLSANPTINAISIGAETSAGANGAVAMGFKTIAKGEYATALGTGSGAYSKGDIALGWKAYTSGFVDKNGENTEPNKIAIGTESTALKENGISIGTKSKTWDKDAIAIGNEAETGNEGGQSSNDSIAIGNKAKIQGQKNVAIGSGVTVGTGAKNNGSSYVVAIGSDSHAYDTDSIVIGGNSEVRENATVIGNRSKAGMESVALGSGIEAGEWSIAIGLKSKAHNHAIAMGMDSDVSGEYAIGIGEEARSFANQSVSMGYRAHAYVGEALAIGNSALVGGERITETAYNALSDAEKKNYTKDDYGGFYFKKDNESYSSTAVGPQARAYGKNATALGSANVGDIWGGTMADGGTAVGSSSNAAYENATAIGFHSIAYAKDAVTIGANTRTDIDGAVALGSDSQATVEAGVYGYDPYKEGRKQESPTWKSTKAAVSVGKDVYDYNLKKQVTETRQITNVAAGTKSTDAVNVAQLKNLKYKLNDDLTDAKGDLNRKITANGNRITNLSNKVEGNTTSINNLKNQHKKDINTLQQYTTHYVSVKSEGMAPNEGNYKNDGAKAEGSIAIGVDTSSHGENAVALGYNAFAVGKSSIAIGDRATHLKANGNTSEEQFEQSITVGNDNTLAGGNEKDTGRENGVFGNKNVVEDSHGAFVRGTGNYVLDAYNSEALTDEDKQKEQNFYDMQDENGPIGLFEKGRSHVIVDGDGNMVAGSLYTQISGVGNEISSTDHDDGTSTPKVTYNIVTGNRNTVVDSSHNLIMGDNHELKDVNGNIIIGSLKTKAKTEKSNVTILGNDANVSEDGGVALGTGSVASTAAGVFGYDPATGEASTTDNAKWKSGNGAVSVGTKDKTRQITNLAAGTADTDAVNVAQLKNSKTAVEAGDYVTVTKKTEDGKGTTYTVKGPSLTSVDKNLTVTDDKDANDKKVGYKLQLSKTLTGLTSVSSDEFKVGAKTYINSQGINANSNKITNVAAGAADGDAVNFKQLSDVKSIATTNQTSIGKLQAGFIVKDAGTGTADVALGGDKKQEVTFKAKVEGEKDATATTKSLSSTVDSNRNVTYSLNINQLKKDLGITDGPDGVMSSWKLKVKDETTPKEIKNGNTVTFEADGDGLTVARTDSTIKYTIDGSKLNIAQNQSITKLGDRIDNLPSIHYVSVYDAKKTGNFDNDGAKKDGGIAIGLRAESNGWNSIALGSDSKATGIQANGGWNIAIGTKAAAEANTFGTAIGYMASATKDKAIALGTMAKTETEDGISIGAVSKSLGKRGIAIGSVSEVSTTGGLGIAIGNAAHVGPAKPSDTTAMPKPSDEWKPANPYESVDDNTKPGKNEGAQEKSIAIGFKAGAFGYQTTALGAGAQAHDSNTTAVGTAAVAKGHHSTALGMQARTFEKESTSVGHWADSRAEFATALGSNTIVYKKGGVALGFGARAYDENSIAIGSNSFAKEAIDGKAYLSDEEVKAAAGIVSVGNPAYKVGDKDFAANYRRIVNVAGGIHDNDAVNVAQLKALEGKVTDNNGDITTLKEGWTLEDAAGSKKVVKATNTVKVTGDDYITATVDPDGLKLGMDETKLNSQINNQINDSETVKAKMNSWVLKATSDKDAEKDGKTIDNKNNAVTFDATGDGLTVTRDGSTITYGIDGSKIDIKGNKSITDLQTEIKESKTTVEAAENSQITVEAKTQPDKSKKYVVDIAKDGTIDGDKDDNLVTGTTVKEYVDANKTTVTGDEEGSGVKVDNIAEDGQPANYKVSLGDKVKVGNVVIDDKDGKGSISGLSEVTVGDNVTLDKTGLTIKEGPSVTTKGIDAGKKKITNVADGDVSENSTDAVNGGQLYKLQQTVAGNKVTVEAAKNSQITVTSETQSDKSTKYVVDIAKDGTIDGDKDDNLVTGETVKKYVDANKTTVTGDEDGSGVKVETIVEKGKPTNYKVSLGDKIKAGDVTVDGTEGKGQIKGLSNTTWDADNIVSGRAATEDQLKEVSKNAAAEAAKKQTTLVAGDYVTVSEGTNTAGGKEYTVTGPKLAVVDGEENLVVGDITEGNKKVGYNLKLNKELKGLTSVSSDTFKSGDKVTINNEGLTIKDGPSVTTKGIDAGGKTIANVADGKADTDAVNVRQLNAIANAGNQNLAILGGKVSELDGRVNRVGAGAAALAALHPLDFDPDDKWDFAAGYGNYSGANAVAIGAYYRPNEDTMFSVGGSFGGGENMVNAGVSVKLGQGNNVTTSKIAMAKEIKDLRAEVEVLRQAIVGVGQGQELDPMKMKLFPDIEKNHWAYEAVEELAKQG